MICLSHQREITTQERYGVLCYAHSDDGSRCTPLNTFATSVDEHLCLLAKTMEYAPTPLVVAAMYASSAVRSQLYEQMQQAHTQECLSALLCAFYELYRASSETGWIHEASVQFGALFLTNLELATGSRDVAQLQYDFFHFPATAPRSMLALSPFAEFGRQALLKQTAQDSPFFTV